MADKKDIPLALLEILKEYTDDTHFLSTSHVIEIMKSKYHLDLERRTIYANAELLKKYGYKISNWSENNIRYGLVEHQFSPKEAVSLCRMIDGSDEFSRSGKEKLKKKILETLSIAQREMVQETNKTK